MFRSVQDQAYPSGAVVPAAADAFQTTPNLEGIDASVLDNRASGSTAVSPGTLFVEQFLAANPGDANYQVSGTASQPLPMFSYGVLTGVASNPSGAPAQSANLGKTTGGGFEIRIRQKGACYAFCTTGATAIAPGTPLAADGAGNLIPYTGTAPGVVLAISKGTLAANTAAATLVLVNVGGY